MVLTACKGIYINNIHYINNISEIIGVTDRETGSKPILMRFYLTLTLKKENSAWKGSISNEDEVLCLKTRIRLPKNCKIPLKGRYFANPWRSSRGWPIRLLRKLYWYIWWARELLGDKIVKVPIVWPRSLNGQPKRAEKMMRGLNRCRQRFITRCKELADVATDTTGLEVMHSGSQGSKLAAALCRRRGLNCDPCRGPCSILLIKIYHKPC